MRWSELTAARRREGYSVDSFFSSDRALETPSSEPNEPNEAKDGDGATVSFDELAGALEFDHRQPRDVAEAVASLSVMPAPDNVDAGRWRELIADAGRFASAHWAEAEAKGWTVRRIFGVAPGFARTVDRDGLVCFLRGREVGAITAEYIEIAGDNGPLRFPRREGSGAVPLWSAAHG